MAIGEPGGEEYISDRAKKGLAGGIHGEFLRGSESPSLVEEARRSSGVCPS